MNLLAEGGVTAPVGFTAAAIAAGLKSNNELDLAIVHSQTDCVCSAVFTQNQVVAAPVVVDRETLAENNRRVRAIVANAKVANACTGEPGLANARATQRMAAQVLGCAGNQVLVLSTGVIGVQLPMEKMRQGIEKAAQHLGRGSGLQAASAIMTTDTVPKHLAVSLNLPGGTVTIGGMAKGAGMIHPNMATMLALITTDAAVQPQHLDSHLRTAVAASFNRISIDGDTSTNDTVLVLANGASNVLVESSDSAALFQEALTYVCLELAKMIVRDGEGATKFVEICVCGAGTEADAQAIANTIATSPLVKTAFAGSDPNWGRILAAAGRAGIIFDQTRLNLWIGATEPRELQLVCKGTPTDYQETAAAAIFARDSFCLQLDLDAGEASATLWTTDLTGEYIRINADYRT